MAERGEKYIDTEWTWLTDYAYWTAEWTLDAEAGCELEVGLGMKIAGKPRGGTYTFKQHINLATRGIGAIHVRAVAGRAPCLVKLGLGYAGAIPVYGDPSVVKGLIHDGIIVYEKAKDVAKEAFHSVRDGRSRQIEE